MNPIIVIPARLGSSRFPGKPLALIAGRSLLQRVHAIASAVAGVKQVIIATDSPEIKSHAESFGAVVAMTPEGCRNGTERTAAALQALKLEPEIVINLQGDAVLTPPWFIEALIAELSADQQIGIATPAVQLSAVQREQLTAAKAVQPSAGTLVTFNRSRDALYFSKQIIPFIRGSGSAASPVYKHIGIYGYRSRELERYISLAPTPLEEAEGLEQLRALEHGLPIRVVVVDPRGRTLWSIDTPEDVAAAEGIIKREGELV